MRGVVAESKARWAIAGIGAAVGLAAVLMLFRFPAPSTAILLPRAAPLPKASVRVEAPDGSDLLLKAEAELRDLKPLFLPTARNAALPEPRLEPGRTFLDNETLKLKYGEGQGDVSHGLPGTIGLGGKPFEHASLGDALGPKEVGLDLQGFGRADAKVEPMPARGGYVEVLRLKDGVRVLGEPLAVEARPPADKAWSPVEFMAVVDAAGLVSPLVVVEGSRHEEVDVHFRNYLALQFRIGERLEPGFYRITVAP
jgi:hypothetical protein